MWICQAGGEKADFSVQKNIGQGDFYVLQHPVEQCAWKRKKTPFAGLFCKEEEEEKNACKKNGKVLL